MIGTNEAPGAWYPMWSYSNSFTTDTEGGMAWNKIAEIKHEYLPQVVMAKDFDAAWAEYMDAYNGCDPEDRLSVSYRQNLIREWKKQRNTNNT